MEQIDVFRVPKDGGVHWIGSVETWEAAKVLIKAESAKQSGDSLIVNLETGEKTEIKASAA